MHRFVRSCQMYHRKRKLEWNGVDPQSWPYPESGTKNSKWGMSAPRWLSACRRDQSLNKGLSRKEEGDTKDSIVPTDPGECVPSHLEEAVPPQLREVDETITTEGTVCPPWRNRGPDSGPRSTTVRRLFPANKGRRSTPQWLSDYRRDTSPLKPMDTERWKETASSSSIPNTATTTVTGETLKLPQGDPCSDCHQLTTYQPTIATEDRRS